MGQVDAGAMRLAGDRVANGFARTLGESFDKYAPNPCLNVDFNLDRLKDRFEYLLHGRCEDIPHGGTGIGFPAAQDRQQCLSLCLVGMLVDDGEGFATTFVDGARPPQHADGSQTIQSRVTEVSSFDFKTCHCLTISMGRARVELTRTAVGAVTGYQLVCLNFPRCHRFILTLVLFEQSA